jgi:hypothetical protein
VILIHYLLVAMTPSKRLEFTAIRELSDKDDNNLYDCKMMDGILDGTERMDVSHVGVEFEMVMKNMEEDIQAAQRCR